MAAEPMPHQAVENKNRALWDEIAPVHPKAYKEAALLREGGEVLDEIELRVREVGDVPVIGADVYSDNRNPQVSQSVRMGTA